MTLPTSFREFERRRNAGRATRVARSWSELGPAAPRESIWDTAWFLLSSAAAQHLKRPSEQSEDAILNCAIDAYQRKLRWYQDNDQEKLATFVPVVAPHPGENWAHQLMRLSNRYAYLASMDDVDLNDDATYDELLASERALLSHCATAPTASGHTHMRREGAEANVPGANGLTYSRTLCGPVLPDHNFGGETATCPGCLGNRGRPPQLERPHPRLRRNPSFIEVECPTCGALVGVDCAGSMGHPIPDHQQFHQARQYLSRLGPCGTCGSGGGVMCRDERGVPRKAPHDGRQQVV